MNLPIEIKDQYARDILCNRLLQGLPGERWKLIEGFENYAISDFGRLKSLERWTFLPNKNKGKKESEKIMKLILVKNFNHYLQSDSYQIHCKLSSEGKKYRKSIARLVYYHFIEKFDFDDRNILISYKDNNTFHVHYTNLEKVTASEKRLKTFRLNRARNRDFIYKQPVSQYTVDGNWLADFESMYDAEKSLGVSCEGIMDAVNKEFLTAGKFRWFLQNYKPSEEDFIIPSKSDASKKLFNTSLWKKLGKPEIDKDNPPPCLNLSLEDMAGEHWQTIHGFDNRFTVSNLGRVKRLSGWTTEGRKVFLKEQIISQMMNINSPESYSLYCVLRHKKKNTSMTIIKLLYCYFVEKFDLRDNTLVVINNNEPLWKTELSKLSLRPIYDVLKGNI